jgi:hypothetical protein
MNPGSNARESLNSGRRERDKEASELLFKRGRETRRQVNSCSREGGMLHFGWYESISSGA